ncbi:MAG: hypothetical protein ABW046_20580 [Actinoplanes sp.]
MATNDSGLSDEVQVELNPTGPEPDRGRQPDPIPDRPAEGAGRDKWVHYVVALGADRTYVTAETEHFDGVEYVAESSLSRPDLIELANRLGG